MGSDESHPFEKHHDVDELVTCTVCKLGWTARFCTYFGKLRTLEHLTAYYEFAADEITYSTATSANVGDGGGSMGHSKSTTIKKGQAMVKMVRSRHKDYCISCFAKLEDRISKTQTRSLLLGCKGKAYVISSDYVIKDASYGDF